MQSHYSTYHMMATTNSIDTQTGDPWTQTPLNCGRPCIRVLRLHPGFKDEPITCSLEVVDLDDAPYYETLSYVWGNSSNTRPMTVCDTPFNATVNLHDFLQCLRLPSADRLVWADAICIDQSNGEEKSYQIGLMTRIYRDARQSHIWFGPFNSASFVDDLYDEPEYLPADWFKRERFKTVQREGDEWLNYFTNEKDFEPLTKEEHRQFAKKCDQDVFLHTLDLLTEMAVHTRHLYTYPIYYIEKKDAFGNSQHKVNWHWLLVYDCMHWLMSRDWWTRVWTLQEAVLPRVDPIVHAPPYSFNLSKLLDGIHQMFRHKDARCCKFCEVPVFTTYRDQTFRASQILNIYKQRQKLKTAQKNAWIPLADVIESIQNRSAKEIRDHWFGITGFLRPLWKEADRRTRVETWSTGELFSKYSKLLYSESKNLTYLAYARGQEECKIEGLPSWAINLSMELSRNTDFRRWNLYHASGEMHHVGMGSMGIRFWEDTKTPVLLVKSSMIGTVSACGDLIPFDVLHSSDGSEMARKLLNEWISLFHEHASSPDDNAFWRSIFMDTDVWLHWMSPRRGKLKQQRVNDIKLWWNNWNRTKSRKDLTLDQKSGGKERGEFHWRALSRNLDTTRFFITSEGIPGMGPHDMKPSDEIYVLAGCQALAVLRKLDRDGESILTFVGLCFLDKWMHGKATGLQGIRTWQHVKLF